MLLYYYKMNLTYITMTLYLDQTSIMTRLTSHHLIIHLYQVSSKG